MMSTYTTYMCHVMCTYMRCVHIYAHVYVYAYTYICIYIQPDQISPRNSLIISELDINEIWKI